MPRSTLPALIALTLTFALLSAQDRPRAAKIKRYDHDKSVIVLTVDGKDHELTITDRTRVMRQGAGEVPPAARQEALKAGADVLFLARTLDGKDVLVGLRLPAGGAAGKVDTSKLTPLPELGEGKYNGFEGGLYPGGRNVRPAAHEKAGLALAGKVEPLDAAGKPSKDGKIVLLSVGMSNASQVFSAFKAQADRDEAKSAKVVIVNGAQGGMTAARIQDADSKTGKTYWTTTDDRLRAAKVTPAQVQAIWIKQADAGPSSGFPAYARALHSELANIVRLLPKRYPNVKLVYLSPRTYGGYATTRLNPEPYAYESGFAVKWLIEEQLKGKEGLNFDPAKGKVAAPWLSWGPYLWANGERKNGDGLLYVRGDFGGDGTHPSPQGQRKVGERLLMFFKTDTTTRPWFVAREGRH